MNSNLKSLFRAIPFILAVLHLTSCGGQSRLGADRYGHRLSSDGGFISDGADTGDGSDSGTIPVPGGTPSGETSMGTEGSVDSSTFAESSSNGTSGLEDIESGSSPAGTSLDSDFSSDSMNSSNSGGTAEEDGGSIPLSEGSSLADEGILLTMSSSNTSSSVDDSTGESVTDAINSDSGSTYPNAELENSSNSESADVNDICAEESFRIKLNPMCPNGAPASGFTLFAEARRPIVSVEVRVSDTELEDNPRSQFPSHNSKRALAAFANNQARGSYVLYTIDLLQEDIFGPHFWREVKLDYSAIAGKAPDSSNPRGWNQPLVTVYVCDDRNGDGKCSDEELSRQISLRSSTHRACHLPSAIPVNVYHCR